MSRPGRRFTLRQDHPSEDVEQASFFDWLHAKRYRGQSLAPFYFAVPNGGSRHLIEAVKLKRTGVTPGAPDVIGCIAAGTYHAHAIEMKAHGGRLSDAQREFHARLRDCGWRVDVCFGWYEAAQAVERYLAGGLMR